MSDPSPYDKNARFRCSQGCGTTERQDCRIHNGRLVCPRCRYIGTLRWEGDDEERDSP